MKRFLAALLVFLLLIPNGALAGGGPEQEGTERKKPGGSPILWGTMAVLNGALLVSSIIDLQFYQDRADDVEASGGDATPYWDASGREKVIIGLSAISLVFSLAALKNSFGPEPDFRLPPYAQSQTTPPPPAPEGEEPKLISHEGRVRYDTLFTAREVPAAPGEEEVPEGEGETVAQLLSLETRTRVDTVYTDLAEVIASGGDTVSFAEPAAAPDPEAVETPQDVETPEDVETPQEAEPVVTESAGEAGPVPDPIVDIIRAFGDEGAATAETELVEAEVEAEAPLVTPSVDEVPAVDTTGEEAVVPEVAAEAAGPEPATVVAKEPEAPQERRLPEPDFDIIRTPDFALLPFAVHVSSFRSFEGAETDEARWIRRGHKVTIEERDLGDRGIWFRVLVGNFADYAEAEKLARDVSEKYGIEYTQAVRRSGF